MAVAQRSLARLDPELFVDLVADESMVVDDGAQLRDDICKRLRNITRTVNVGSLLHLSTLAWMQSLDPLLTYDECRELRRRICRHCAPPRSTAYDLLHRSKTDAVHHCLPTGLPSLDVRLAGGMRTGSLSELVGRSGVGKTQLALQLCLEAARLNGGAVYVDTEKKLSLPRLQEMAAARKAVVAMEATHRTDDENVGKANPHSAHTTEMQYRDPVDVLRNVTLHSPTSTDELLTVLTGLEEEILERNEEALQNSNLFPVRLIVVDSIAAPARRDFGADSAAQRAAAVLQAAQILKRLADELSLAVVIVNQCGGGGAAEEGSTAALGTAWHHCVSTRIELEHEAVALPSGHSMQFEPNVPAMAPASQSIRHATIVKSNMVRSGIAVDFQIATTGVIDPAVPTCM